MPYIALPMSYRFAPLHNTVINRHTFAPIPSLSYSDAVSARIPHNPYPTSTNTVLNSRRFPKKESAGPR